MNNAALFSTIQIGPKPVADSCYILAGLVQFMNHDCNVTNVAVDTNSLTFRFTLIKKDLFQLNHLLI